MKTDEQQIRQLVADWHAATKAGDLDTVLGLMTDDAIFLVPGRPPMDKLEFASLSRMPAGKPRSEIDGTSKIQEIRVCGDWAFMWARLSVIVTPPDRGRPMERAGHTLTVLKRVAGRWLLARDANLLTPVQRPNAENGPARISILYPNRPGACFDMRYYVDTHMPLSIGLLSTHPGFRGVSVERGVSGVAPGSAADFVAMCHFTFASAEDFLTAFMPHAATLQGDMPNYTDIVPVIQVNEVLIAR